MEVTTRYGRAGTGRYLLSAAVASLLAVPAAAAAAPTWLSPTNVGAATTPSCFPSGAYLCGADVAVAPDGTAFVAAVNYDPDAGNRRRASVSVRAPGGTFSQPQMLSPANADVAGSESGLIDIAVDGAGGATVAWTYLEGAVTRVQAAYRPPGATAFDPPQTLSAAGRSASEPTVGVSDNGGAIVAWQDTVSGSATVKATYRRPGDRTFSGAPFDLSAASTTLSSPKLVMAPNGAAAATWVNNGTIQAIISAAGAAFAGATPVSLDGNATFPASEPDIAIAPNGRVTVIWRFDPNTSTFGDEVIRSREFRGTGGWSGLDTVTASGETGSAPAVAVDGDDNAVAVWNGTISGTFRVRAATRASGASFSDHAPVSAGNTKAWYGPKVSVNAAGDAVAIWSAPDAGLEVVQAARKPKGQPFGRVDVLLQGTSAPSASSGVWFRPTPRLAFDGEGNAFATWIAYSWNGSTTTNVVQAAGFDAAPPAFTNIAAPATATAGVPATLSATARDRMTSPRITWAFGDGATAAGGSVQHTFAGPGNYTVTITATDAVGNSTSATRAIQVTAPTPPPPPGVEALSTKVTARWLVRKSYTQVRALKLEKVVKGTTVTISCRGRGCPWKSRKLSIKATAGSKALTGLFAKKRKQAKLKPGVQVRIAMVAPGRVGRAWKATIRAGKAPKVGTSCLAVGSSTKAAGCAG